MSAFHACHSTQCYAQHRMNIAYCTCSFTWHGTLERMHSSVTLHAVAKLGAPRASHAENILARVLGGALLLLDVPKQMEQHLLASERELACVAQRIPLKSTAQ